MQLRFRNSLELCFGIDCCRKLGHGVVESGGLISILRRCAPDKRVLETRSSAGAHANSCSPWKGRNLPPSGDIGKWRAISRCKSASPKGGAIERATTLCGWLRLRVACVDTVLAAIEGRGGLRRSARAEVMRKTEIKVGPHHSSSTIALSCDLFVPLPGSNFGGTWGGAPPSRILF